MFTTTEDKDIPRYAFEPDAATGHPMFRIDKNREIRNYRRLDFFVPHRKDYYFLAFVKVGSSRHWIDMKSYVLQPDTLYFTVPQQVHLKEDSDAPLSGISVCFSEAFLAAAEGHFLKELPLIQNPFNGHELKLNAADVVFVEDMLERIYTEYHTAGQWQQGMLMAYLKVLLIYLSRLYTEQFAASDAVPEKRILKQYLAYINERYTDSHEVADYAAVMNLSAGYLSEVIKAQSGKPPIAHIHERLMLEARRLLFHSELSVKEIAFELGFEDDSYFNRFFKRLNGQTPVAYRTDTRKMYH